MIIWHDNISKGTTSFHVTSEDQGLPEYVQERKVWHFGKSLISEIPFGSQSYVFSILEQ